MNEWIAPTVISSAIGGGVALATHFSAQSAKRRESREDIRTQAFTQAKDFYTDMIERQDTENDDLRTQVAELRGQVVVARGEVTEAVRRATMAEEAAATCRAAVRRLSEALSERDQRIKELESL